MDKPLVSISCITYNHEKYIRKCLDGFLMQKAHFSFEILINDDASTDGTAIIIKEYETKYPNLIKPIYQLENQYSKGQRGINVKYNFPRAKGKYIALCEGDDYWTDPLKLQKQVNFMESQPEVHFCFTGHQIFNDGANKFVTPLTNFSTGLLDKYEIIKNGASTFATGSLMITEELSSLVITSSKKTYFNIPGGDLMILLLGAHLGEIGYLKDETTVYRVNASGSWTSINEGNDFKALYNSYKKTEILLNYFIKTTGDKKFKNAVYHLKTKHNKFLFQKLLTIEKNRLKRLGYLMRHWQDYSKKDTLRYVLYSFKIN